MPSFFILGLAKYFAASKMASRSSASSTTPKIDEVHEGVVVWNHHMRWLIPFVQASGYSIIIENPKSHEEIVIDKGTKKFPKLSSKWLKRCNKEEINEWKKQADQISKAYQVKVARGRARFGDSFLIENIK